MLIHAIFRELIAITFIRYKSRFFQMSFLLIYTYSINIRMLEAYTRHSTHVSDKAEGRSPLRLAIERSIFLLGRPIKPKLTIRCSSPLTNDNR